MATLITPDPLVGPGLGISLSQALNTSEASKKPSKSAGSHSPTSDKDLSELAKTLSLGESEDLPVFAADTVAPSDRTDATSRSALALLGAGKQESVDPKVALNLFARDEILIRAMEDDLFTDIGERGKIDFRTWDSEVDLLENQGLRNCSCTLLLPGTYVATYKPLGILYSSRTSDVFYAADHDILSNTDSKGMNVSPEAENRSLQDIAKIVRSGKAASSMNEVRAHFKTRDAVGLVYCAGKDPGYERVSILKMLVMQKRIKDKTGTTLPIFKYHAEKGALEVLDPKTYSIRMLLGWVKGIPGLGKPAAESIEQYLNLSR
jgi:hypothetical protein